MAQEFIHVRVDPAKKREAERILNNLGLTMSAGIIIYLNSIIRAKGLPLEVKLNREELLGEKAYRLEAGFQSAVAESIDKDHANGFPVALYDKDKKIPYLEYPDGRREYDEG